MDSNLLLFIIAILAVVVIYFGYRLKQPKNDVRRDDQGLVLLQNQMADIKRTLDEKLSESRNELNSAVKYQFTESQKLIKDITAQVAQVQESNKQVFNIADQLQNLEKVFKNQKQRGNVGEASLELVLTNILPPTAFKLQYEFKNGDRVDAVIITKDGMIPIDAKFSLDNYSRLINETDEQRKVDLEKEFKDDLKKRIDETSKYIKTKEGTLPFAFMFIPAEAIYYDLLINEIGAVKSNTRSLIDYAYKDKNVIVVSPTTFPAYLQSVLYGFRAFRIEESAQKIIKWVEDLRKHIGSYEEYMKKLGNNLRTTVTSYNIAHKELGKIDKDVMHITDKAAGIEPIVLDKPQEEDEE